MVDQDFNNPLAFRSLHSYSPLFARKDQNNRNDFSTLFRSDPMEDEFKSLLEDTDSYLKRMESDATAQVVDEELPINKDILPVNGETTRAFADCVTAAAPVEETDTTQITIELDPISFPHFQSSDEEIFMGGDDGANQVVSGKQMALSTEQSLLDARTVPKIATVPEQETRLWTIFEKDATIITPDVVPKIQMKTRKDPLSEVVPDKIYSSLVYVVEISVPVLMGCNVLMAKLSVLDTDLQPVINDQPVLLNDISGALYQTDGGKRFEGKVKFRFNPKLKMTYHQTKKEYHLQLNVEHPQSRKSVLTMMSPKLRIYGRKLNKRKREPVPKEEPKLKKPKMSQGQQVELFQSRLSQLLQFCMDLGQDEKSACLHILQQALEGKK